MKVILTRDVPNVGKDGEVVTVADGYARNYLFPRQLAIVAKGAAMKSHEARIARDLAKSFGLPPRRRLRKRPRGWRRSRLPGRLRRRPSPKRRHQRSLRPNRKPRSRQRQRPPNPSKPDIPERRPSAVPAG